MKPQRSTLILIQNQLDFFDENNHVDPTEYRHICGSLKYPTFIRTCITHAVDLVRKHFQTPTQKDLYIVKQISHYIKETLTHDLRYLSQISLTINDFCDAHWVSCSTTR